MFARGVTDGATASMTDIHAGDRGVACRLDVRWPDGTHRRVWHVYLLRDGQICEILAPGSRRAALEAIGGSARTRSVP